MNKEKITKEFASSITQTLVNLIGAQAVRAIFAQEFSNREIFLGKTDNVEFSPGDIEERIKKLTSILTDRSIRNFGYDFSEHVLSGIYNNLKDKYGADESVFIVLDLAPEGSLEKEKIKYLSKDELEKRVLERTRELQETNANLEKTVVDRTKELVMANYKLEEAIQELKELNKMKSEFLSLASHQMRSPLTESTWSLSRLKELFEKSSSIGEENRKLLEDALSRNKIIAKLIDNLLNISRIEAGRFFKKFERVFVASSVSEVVSSLLVMEERRSVSIEYEPPKSDLVVMADKEKLSMAIENVIDNAIKYSPDKGKVVVSIIRERNNVIISGKDKGM
jgi:signal transduction histidine kinase